MSQRTLNLGILAHVDAGKTTLTERLLYAAGVIDQIGSVDQGTTQTDSLPLEQQRGITIKSAVVSFAVGDVKVNLIDTPGHPDFIAEVERVLRVLDGAVLVISAVEGVQSRTLVLMRALQRLRISTLIFVNKIDRSGADEERVLRAISDRLTTSIVPMGSVSACGTRAARFLPWEPDDSGFRARLIETLAEHDDRILAAYLEDASLVPHRTLGQALATHAQSALVHPVFLGSARTGAGVESLMAGLTELLPARAADPNGPVSGSVFKIERGPSGEKVAYARMFSGTLHVRDRVRGGRALDDRITGVRVFDNGSATRCGSVRAGEIGKLWGLTRVRIGDAIGEHRWAADDRQFATPMLEAVVEPDDPGDGARLWIALTQLQEQDPLINVRHDDDGHEIFVSLYGEVQKEVIQATLRNEFGIAASFRKSTPIYVERPAGPGEALEVLHAPSNPFNASIGLRVEPSADGSGVDFELRVDANTVPLYVYKSVPQFVAAMDQYVRASLREGLHGWQVADCVVTMTSCTYSSPDGPPATRGPKSTAADFRKLTPIVMMRALARAGTVVCEPMVRATIEIPTESIGRLLPLLSRLDAVVHAPSLQRTIPAIEAVLPASRVQELQRLVPAFGGGGVAEAELVGHRPFRGEPPTRKRTTPNPLNLGEYMMHLTRRVHG